MNYLQVRTKVKGLLNRNNATDAQIAAWVQSGLQRIQRELRCPAMEKVVSVTIASTYNGLIVPADMVEMIDILNQDGDRVIKDDITTVIRSTRGIPGKCRIYYRMGGKYLLGPQPASGDVITLVYYSELGELVLDTDSNVLTEIADDLVTFAGLVFAGTNYTDTRKPDWENEYQRILGDMQGTSDADELSGGTCVSPAWDWPDDSVGYGNG